MANRYGYDERNQPFMIVETEDRDGNPQIEINDMKSPRHVVIPDSVWQDMVSDWAEYYTRKMMERDG